jgi:xanthine phosphoribosyltransferase
MKELEERIRREGEVLPGGILKVDAFLNAQVDPLLMKRIGEEFHRLFASEGVTKVLTIEASGIVPAVFTALSFQVPMVFAKKAKSANINGDVLYTARVRSFTYGRNYDILVPKKFIQKEDHVLIVDDFLANGLAAEGLLHIIDQAGAVPAGIGACIAKTFQPGMKRLEEEGYHVEALAAVKEMDENRITFE